MTISTVLLEMTRGAVLTAAVIGLARVTLKRVLTPKAKYYLWLLLALRLMLPVLPESPLSLMNYLPDGQPMEATAPEVQTVEDVANHTNAGDPVWWEHDPTAVPAAPEAPKAPALTVETPHTDPVVVEAPAAPQSPAAPDIPTETILLWVWLGGMGAVLLVYLVLYAITALQLRRLPCVTDSETLRTFLRLKRALGIQGKVKLVTGGGGMLGGLLRPTIVLPAERHGEDVTPILVHELLHYKYKDMWLSLLFRLLTAIHWFNPVVWLCFHLMRGDSEAACDQRVLETGLVQKGSYATLLYEEGVLQMKNGVLMHTTFGGDRHSLRRRIRLIAQFRRPKVWTTVLAVVLALMVTACTLTEATSHSGEQTSDLPSSQIEFDAYMQPYQPPNGVFGLTFAEHVDQGLLDPEQGILEHYTYAGSGMTYSIFTTQTELGGETVEIAYSFGQNALTDQETLKQVFVTPPEDVPIGTWLENISDPWLSSMAQNTDLNGWEWNTPEYVADLLTENQLARVIDAEITWAEASQSSDFPKTEGDAEHDLKTQWRVVTAFYIGEANLWQFNGTGAALIRAALAESSTVGNPAKADVLPAGMDMDSYIEAIQPGFAHYGWTFQEHVDAGLLNENDGEWEYQNDNYQGDASSCFVTTVALDGSTLEAKFIFSQTLFTRDTDAPQVLTEVQITIPTAVKDGIQWGLDLMEPWAGYMTLGGNDSQTNYCATPVRAGTHLSETQRELAAKQLYEVRQVMNLEDAYAELDNWSIAGGWYMANQGVWQFNGTGAALYLTRPDPKDTDGQDHTLAAEAVASTSYSTGAVSKEDLYAIYAPYGLTYRADKDELWFNGKLVRWFEDYYPLDTGNQAGVDFLNENGVVDVYAVRDLSHLERNPDGSTDPSGKLTGVNAFSEEEFAARDIAALKRAAETAVAGDPLSSKDLQDMLDEYAPFGITYDEKQDQWYYNGDKIGRFLDILTSNGESPSGGNFRGTMRSFSGDGTLELETVRDYQSLNADGNGTLTGIKVNGQLQAVTPPTYAKSRDSITYGNTQWGITPEAVLAAEGLNAGQWVLHNRGKNYYMNGTIPDHPEVEKAEFQFHFTGLDLTLGLDYVEVEYNQDLIRYEELLALRKQQFGPPTSTQGNSSSWDLEDVGLTLTLTTNGFLREMLNYYGTLYDAEALLESFDAEEYLSTIQPPNGHYGWTYDQHVEAGLLDPDSGTLTLEQDTEAGRAHSFATQIELDGETVEAVYVFSTTLATVDGSEKEVLTQVMVTPPEGAVMSKWIGSFSDSFTDKLFESSSLQYKTPIAVGGLLSEEDQEEIMAAARTWQDGYAPSLGGWPLVVNWFQQDARIWHFNGTGAALYLTAMESA